MGYNDTMGCNMVWWRDLPSNETWLQGQDALSYSSYS
jgi:hypothetical protein